ncbi:MAG: hypothetical protein WAS56_01245 [Saprospiraceae bacterium]|nr:hypothetical protein [Saprospiraceae bacterium]MBK7467709.1 hypothetical protein [Saprospiraceae bacterium]
MKTKFFFFLAIIFTTSMIRLSAQDYTTAVGLRAAWGYGLSAKHFISDNAAIELIGRYRSYSSSTILGKFSYNYLSITGLYQMHKEIDAVDGLAWYWGGGASLGFYGGDFKDINVDDKGSTNIGICGNLGLDYKFANIPLNISADWIPTFLLSGYGNGFSSESGGLAIRYTLK